MAICVQIPGVFRVYTGGSKTVTADGTTVAEVLLVVTRAHPQMKAHVYTPEGELRRSLNVFVNDEDIRFLQNSATPVQEGDTLMLIPAISGG